MKIVTVVGARPQFIKASVVSHILRKRHIEVLVHTGQHYDYNMSELFFEELDIPKPDYNLGISGGTHAQMTGRMLISIEEVLQKEKPDWVLVYGDTNSTLAAALAASKLHIPICHVEAGVRTKSLNSPEEINRICVDHISTLTLAVIGCGMKSLEEEGLKDRSIFVGDPMYDAYLKYSGKMSVKELKLRTLSEKIIDVPSKYYYLTCHREENTNTDKKIVEILDAMNSLDAYTIYPVHPRNRETVLNICNNSRYNNIILIEPVGYIESICLLNNSEKVVTDSGGLQREAFFAKKKCVTLLDHIGCEEIFVNYRNELSKPIKSEIIEKLNHEQILDDSMPFGDGNSAEKIVQAIEGFGR